MTGSPDDLPPPTLPPAPDFDAEAPEADLDLAFDVPAPLETPGGDAPTPWYRGMSLAVVAVLLVVAVVVVVTSRTPVPPVEEADTQAVVPSAPAAAAGPSAVVQLADDVIAEQAPLPNVTAVRPLFVPAGAPMVEVAGRQADGTVSRPDGTWLRVTLAPGVYTFRVAAGADTELHLSDVFTELTFNDDTDGLNPVITERLIGGDYYLWLHIHDDAVEGSAPFALTIDGPG
jgi:hypothetical protein